MSARLSPRILSPKNRKECISNFQWHDLFEFFKNANFKFFSVGLYALHLKKFLDRFSRRQFLVLDGEELRTNPGRVMDKVQGFIGLPRCLKNENFVFNETKGFYCILDKDGNQQCLDSNKGTSRKRLLKLKLTSSDMGEINAPKCRLIMSHSDFSVYEYLRSSKFQFSIFEANSYSGFFYGNRIFSTFMTCLSWLRTTIGQICLKRLNFENYFNLWQEKRALRNVILLKPPKSFTIYMVPTTVSFRNSEWISAGLFRPRKRWAKINLAYEISCFVKSCHQLRTKLLFIICI